MNSYSQKTYGIREIANWILDFADTRNVSLTNMALNKLIFFAYEHALISHGRKLTKAKIEAWDHGPVFREVYRSFKEFGKSPITNRAAMYDAKSDQISVVIPTIANEDAVIIEEAIEPLVSLPASVLRELSHDAHGSWSAVWHHKARSNPGMQITDSIILSSQPSRTHKQ